MQHLHLLSRLLTFLGVKDCALDVNSDVAWVLSQTCPVCPGTSLLIIKLGLFRCHLGTLWWSSQGGGICTLNSGAVISSSLCYCLCCYGPVFAKPSEEDSQVQLLSEREAWSAAGWVCGGICHMWPCIKEGTGLIGHFPCGGQALRCLPRGSAVCHELCCSLQQPMHMSAPLSVPVAFILLSLWSDVWEHQQPSTETCTEAARMFPLSEESWVQLEMAGTRAVMNSCRVLLFSPPLCLMVESVRLHTVQLESPESILCCAGTAKCWQGDAGSGKTKCLSPSQCTNIPVSSLSCLLLHASFEVLHSQPCIMAWQRAGKHLQTWRTWRWTGPGLWSSAHAAPPLFRGISPCHPCSPSLHLFLPASLNRALSGLCELLGSTWGSCDDILGHSSGPGGPMWARKERVHNTDLLPKFSSASPAQCLKKMNFY